MKKAIGITDVILRDAHQSLLATRLRLDDMLPAAEMLDQVGFWSLESWGGATFDACIRYLGEDPWERIREFKKAMPKTPQQMLLRGQNLLGYRHYADDVVTKFIERAVKNGIDVFRIFDALNDVRNMQTAIKAVRDMGRHAQGTIAYTISPVHTEESWVDIARQIEDLGADSLAIKDMAGLLNPYTAENLVRELKKALSIPIHMQTHATTGMSTATILKAVEAGIDNIDTAISSLSMTYGHSATETIVAIFQGTEWDTGLNLDLLEPIATHFREVRERYTKFEGKLRGIDARILNAQVPGGMFSNMENQLREQNALQRMDEVLREIPIVRKDLGYLPLVTPTSQIVASQAVLNVLSGMRYRTLSRETIGVLTGEYGKTPAPVNEELQTRALNGKKATVCRPADLIKPEMERLQVELRWKAEESNINLSPRGREIDDTLIYALFPQIGWEFLQHRGDPEYFEPTPEQEAEQPQKTSAKKTPQTIAHQYKVRVDNQEFQVDILSHEEMASDTAVKIQQEVQQEAPSPDAQDPGVVTAPLSGNIFSILVKSGQQLSSGTPMLILEAMKMETPISAPRNAKVGKIFVSVGDKVAAGDPLLQLL